MCALWTLRLVLCKFCNAVMWGLMLTHFLNICLTVYPGRGALPDADASGEKLREAE